MFFGVPGSGEGGENPPPGVVATGITQADADVYGNSVARLKVDLAKVAGNQLGGAAAVKYPAIPADKYFGPAGITAGLDKSEATGVAVLTAAVRKSLGGGCAARAILLAGYSQGAEVAVRTIDALGAAQQRQVSVALLGNPSYEPGRPGDYPGATKGKGLRPTFLNDAAYTLPADVRARTIDVCAPGDPVCGVDPALTSVATRVVWVLAHITIHDHAYADDAGGLTATAARYLWMHRAA